MASPTLTNTKILYYGLQASYDALATKDSDVLYFCTDSKKIYKGTIEMTESIIVAATKPETGIVTGKLYVISATGTVEFYDGTNWHVVSYPILMSTAGIDENATDVEVPSAKAVYDYVQSIVAGDSVVTAVEASTTPGAISVTVGDDEPVDVLVHGAVTTPSYDAATRTFTFPIADDAQHPVVVELGTDIFIDPDANNRYENGNLYLYLNDGSATTDPTELVIPVTALVTDYFGDDTASISVDVNNTTHKVTASVRIRPDEAGTFENLVKVSSVTGSEGIYVDAAPVRANAAAIETLNGADTVTGSVAYAVKQLADGAVAANTAAITTLNGNASVTGSVDQKVKALADGAVATNTAAIATLNADSSTTGSVAYAIKQLEDSKVDVNAANIAVLATAQSWGTF